MAQTLDMLRDNLPRLEKTFKKTQLLYISSLIWCFDYQSWYDCGTNWQNSSPWQYKHFPCRTFVNMVPLIDVTVTLGMEDKHPFCYISHPYVCPCLYGAGKSIWGGGTPLGRWQNIAIKECIKSLGLCNKVVSSGREWEGCRGATSGNFVTW